jgi:glycosyltransferase involved in cell wall biosynthesis
MAPPEISVIIPARDAAGTLPETLAGLARQSFAGEREVIVVDDGSGDDTAAIARVAPIVDQVVRTPGTGPAAARNAGAASASAPRLAFLDADCRPAPGWLAAGNAALGTFDLVLGETRARPDREHGPFDRSLWVTSCSPLFESANLFVRRELFDRVGGFESWLVPRRGIELAEDVWFGWRAVRAGARVAHCRDALAHHEVYPRDAVAFALERWRLRFFPAMVRRIPELRRAAFHRRYFLTPRAARFDAALAGLAIARLSGRWRFALSALPYARILLADVREPDGAIKAPARAAADAIGLGALVLGSARARTLLL